MEGSSVICRRPLSLPVSACSSWVRVSCQTLQLRCAKLSTPLSHPAGRCEAVCSFHYSSPILAISWGWGVWHDEWKKKPLRGFSAAFNRACWHWSECIAIESQDLSHTLRQKPRWLHFCVTLPRLSFNTSKQLSLVASRLQRIHNKPSSL